MIAVTSLVGPIVYPTGRRIEIGELGYNIYGYPSSGSMIVRDNADIVELAYLAWNDYILPRKDSVITIPEMPFATCFGRLAGSGGQA